MFKSFLTVLGKKIAPYRKRISTLIAVVGVAMIAGHLYEAAPQDTVIYYQLEKPNSATQLSVRYVHQKEAEEVAHAEYRFAQPPTTPIKHQLSLGRGHYDIGITLHTKTTTQHFTRNIRVPNQGTVTLHLSEAQLP